MASEPRYIDVADVAKLVRAALKETFPFTKFSVRIDRYAGGSSIDIHWTDGPEASEIHKITDQFSGAEFDGMTDSMNYHESILNGEAVRFGADFIQCHRNRLLA